MITRVKVSTCDVCRWQVFLIIVADFLSCFYFRLTYSNLRRKLVAGIQFDSSSFERLYQRYFFRSNISTLSILLWLLTVLCVMLLCKSSAAGMEILAY